MTPMAAEVIARATLGYRAYGHGRVVGVTTSPNFTRSSWLGHASFANTIPRPAFRLETIHAAPRRPSLAEMRPCDTLALVRTIPLIAHAVNPPCIDKLLARWRARQAKQASRDSLAVRLLDSSESLPVLFEPRLLLSSSTSHGGAGLYMRSVRITHRTGVITRFTPAVPPIDDACPDEARAAALELCLFRAASAHLLGDRSAAARFRLLVCLATLRIMCATRRSTKSASELPSVLQVCSGGHALNGFRTCALRCYVHCTARSPDLLHIGIALLSRLFLDYGHTTF
jgi:hypothetical protein